VRPAGGHGFTAPVDLEQGQGADTVTAVGNDSAGIIVWQRLGADSRFADTWYAAPTDGHGIGEPQRLLSARAAPGWVPGDPTGPTQIAAAIASSGSVIVSFPYSLHRPRRAGQESGQLAVFAGTPGRLQRVGTLGAVKHGFPQFPRLAIDPGGKSVLAWVNTDTAKRVEGILTARSGPGSPRFGAPTPLNSVRAGSTRTTLPLDLRATSAARGLLDLGPDCDSSRPCTLTARTISTR
jgi:hypothetical protein